MTRLCDVPLSQLEPGDVLISNIGNWGRIDRIMENDRSESASTIIMRWPESTSEQQLYRLDKVRHVGKIMSWKLGQLKYHELNIKTTKTAHVFLMPNGDIGVTLLYGVDLTGRSGMDETTFDEVSDEIWENPALSSCQTSVVSYEKGFFMRIVMDRPEDAMLFKLTYFGQYTNTH